MAKPDFKLDRRPRRRLNWARLARGATWFSLAASSLAFAGSLFWLFDLFAEFRLQFAVLGAALLFVWSCRRRWNLAASAAATLALNLIEILPLYQPAPTSRGPAGAKLKIVQANVFYKNPNVILIQRFLESENADIVCLYEFSNDQAALRPWLDSRYPFRIEAKAIGGAKSAMYSRFPLSAVQPLPSVHTLREGVRCTATIGDQEVDFFVFHPTIPITPGAANGRNGQLEEVAQMVLASPRPALMIGDFNITPFSAAFPPRRHPKLKDLGQGFGPLPTFPMFLPPLLVPIDHMFGTAEFSAANRRLGPFIGSDHLPIVTELNLSDPTGPGRSPEEARL